MYADEKALLVRAAAERRHIVPARRRTRLLRASGLAALVLLGVTVVLFLQPPAVRVGAAALAAQQQQFLSKGDTIEAASTTPTTGGRLVPLEAHLMSKCPDSQDCLRDLILPTMQRVSDKVNFTLSFLGQATADDGVTCVHGPAECMGNVLELCARTLYPDPKIYLGFTWCLAREYEAIPDRALVQDCALEHAIDVAQLDACATRDDGAFAMGLLRASVQRSAAAGILRSCTVRLDEQVYCVRDGGAWTSCPTGPGAHDLIVAIERLYRQG